jgi:cytochrome d ubiquinol oxidase subunit II
MLVLFALGGVWAAHLDGYVVQSFPGKAAASNPLGKQVVRQAGALMANYDAVGWAVLAPALGLGSGLVAALLLASRRLRWLAFLCSGLAIAGIIATAGVSLFPFLLPSSLAPGSSLTVWDASSSMVTLLVMTIATAIFLPIVLSYTGWVYRVLRGPVTAEQIESDPHMSY